MQQNQNVSKVYKLCGDYNYGGRLHQIQMLTECNLGEMYPFQERTLIIELTWSIRDINYQKGYDIGVKYT